MHTAVSILERRARRFTRLFDDRRQLIRALGCQLVFGDDMSRDSPGVVGDPPAPDRAVLQVGGVITAQEGEDGLNYAVHEAMHHFCGDHTLDEELPMILLEFQLYSRLRDRDERRSLLDFLLGTSLGGNSLGHCFRLYGAKYFESTDWGRALGAAQDAGYLTRAGRLSRRVRRELEANLAR
jgi:hypothetical protein